MGAITHRIIIVNSLRRVVLEHIEQYYQIAVCSPRALAYDAASALRVPVDRAYALMIQEHGLKKVMMTFNQQLVRDAMNVPCLVHDLHHQEEFDLLMKTGTDLRYRILDHSTSIHGWHSSIREDKIYEELELLGIEKVE